MVFSFVANAATNDASVIKQARALARAGYRIRIFGRLEAGFAEHEIVDGVEVVRFPCFEYEDLRAEDVERTFREAGEGCFGLFSNHFHSLLSTRDQIDQANRCRLRRISLLERCQPVKIEITEINERIREEQVQNKNLYNRSKLEIERLKDENKRLRERMDNFERSARIARRPLEVPIVRTLQVKPA